MTILSPSIDNSFASAISTTPFFTVKELDKIKLEIAPREQPVLGVPAESCKTNLFFGFFFDGTKNNY